MKWFRLLKSSYSIPNNSRLFFQRFGKHSIYLIPSLFGGYYLASHNVKFLDQIKNSVLPVSVAHAKYKEKTHSFNFIADAVDIAAPSVVHIEVVSKQWQGQFASIGSGFIVTEDGIVLSNAHVVKNSTMSARKMQLKVQLPNGETYPGVIIDVDEVADLAAIKLITHNKNVKFPYVKLGDDVRTGEWVAALGSPLQLSKTVTAGIVSSLHRPSDELGLRNRDINYIQTDAAINVGNSGGPLINLDGEVIGINCFTVQQANGISFAIPANVVKEFLNRALKSNIAKVSTEGKQTESRKQEQQNFYIGIAMLTLTNDILASLRHQNPEIFNQVENGVFVARVHYGSPSERSGLKAGDIIISINGKSVQSATDVYEQVYKGESMKVLVKRKSKLHSINITPDVSNS